MRKVVVVGAGGHAKVVADLLRAGGYEIVGCTDNSRKGGLVNGMPILGREDDVLPGLLRDGVTHVFIALGDNQLRQQLAKMVADLGFEFAQAIGRSAVISPSASIGPGCAIMEGAIVNAEAEIGQFAVINTNASVDHDCRIGAFVHVAPGCALAGNVIVGDRAFLGAGVRVIPRIAIGADVIVGAGAVVARPIDGPGTWAGVPARLLKVADKVGGS